METNNSIHNLNEKIKTSARAKIRIRPRVKYWTQNTLFKLLEEISSLLKYLFVVFFISCFILTFVVMRIEILSVKKEIRDKTKKSDDLLRKNNTLEEGIKSFVNSLYDKEGERDIHLRHDKNSRQYRSPLKGWQHGENTKIIQLELPPYPR